MAHTASNSNHSPVSCLIASFPEIFPLFILFFSLLSLPTEPTGQWDQSENQTDSMLQPLWIFQGQRLPSSFLFASVTNKQLPDNTDIHRRAFAHGNRFFFFFFPICGFFFLFAENANKRKTRFSIEGTSLLQYEDINWIGWIPHAVVSKVLWQLTEHLESQELGFVWRNFPTQVMSKGRWMCGEGEGSWGGGQKEKRKERHWWGRKWEITSVSSLDLLPFLLASGWLQPTQGASWVHSWGLWRLLFCLHFHWTSPLCIFIITYLVPHGTLNVHLSLRNEGCLLGIGPAYSSLWERISQVRSQSLQNIPQWSTSGSPWA